MSYSIFQNISIAMSFYIYIYQNHKIFTVDSLFIHLFKKPHILMAEHIVRQIDKPIPTVQAVKNFVHSELEENITKKTMVKV